MQNILPISIPSGAIRVSSAADMCLIQALVTKKGFLDSPSPSITKIRIKIQQFLYKKFNVKMSENDSYIAAAPMYQSEYGFMTNVLHVKDR